MMKKIVSIFLPLLLLSAMITSASAVQYVHDNGDILTEEEEAYLEEEAASVSDERGISVVIVTENGVEASDLTDYGEDFYDYGGYADDGAILVLDMDRREWVAVTSGIMMDAFGDHGYDRIGDIAVPYFSDGEYESGFAQYIDITASLYDDYMDGGEDAYYDDEYDGYYDDDEYYDDYEDDYRDRPVYTDSEGVGWMYYAVALGISLLIAFLVCSGFKRQLNTAVKKSGAGNYFDSDDVTMVRTADRFLYSRTSKIRKSDDSSKGGRSGGTRISTGSSGRAHRSGGGRF